MKEQLEKIKRIAVEAIDAADNLDFLNQLRIRFLGKKGEITGVLKEMGKLSAEERPIIGAVANQVKNKIANLIESKTIELESAAKFARLQEEKIDLTLPGEKIGCGKIHPLTAIYSEVKNIFIGMGFDIAEGPEIEMDYYNFEALNMPRWHPARDMQDSFFITEEVLLRTHTSPVQVRTMEKVDLPIRIIAPGRVYRVDEVDATHSPNFQQVEGLVIDKGINFGNLKATIDIMVKKLFGENRKTRFRPSYFPFTEPSAEVDVSCICDGKGCRVCKGNGWVEIMGAGMVHPRVLEMSKIDPEEYSGFAFGIGVERIAMLKYDIPDIRLFYENDLRFLNQF